MILLVWEFFVLNSGWWLWPQKIFNDICWYSPPKMTFLTEFVHSHFSAMVMKLHPYASINCMFKQHSLGAKAIIDHLRINQLPSRIIRTSSLPMCSWPQIDKWPTNRWEKIVYSELNKHLLVIFRGGLMLLWDGLIDM